ncbi:YigZ family protein [Ammoniphilus oxalaticus]|uniref:YigZ family protein n=1 Tax=Ammoniphilus oxalaticus TaxID=66863 RepID=A0A419SEL5_9BACL|nr:YigZ family protein [Ammoniphilus oxalaticus]RKD21753.1 YigZ family protein [Ammoniphilus oxalaticus]
MIKKYLTVAGFGETEIEINRSRFICYAQRAESEEEARAFISTIKKKHWDATHNCSAYLVGEHDDIQKADDDGEPSGTAGKPILEVLKRNQVKDTVVVITRYFGGIKLGAGGLIRAYGRSASEALKAGMLVERVLHETYQFELDYTFLGKIENELRARQDYIIDEITYLESVVVTVLVESGQEQPLLQWITDETSGQVQITQGEPKYVEFECAANESPS